MEGSAEEPAKKVVIRSPWRYWRHYWKGEDEKKQADMRRVQQDEENMRPAVLKFFDRFCLAILLSPIQEFLTLPDPQAVYFEIPFLLKNLCSRSVLRRFGVTHVVLTLVPYFGEVPFQPDDLITLKISFYSEEREVILVKYDHRPRFCGNDIPEILKYLQNAFDDMV